MGHRNELIVKNVNANIPVFIVVSSTFLGFLLPPSAQPIDSSLQWPSSVSLQKRGCPRLRFCDSAAGKYEKESQEKQKKPR